MRAAVKAGAAGSGISAAVAICLLFVPPLEGRVYKPYKDIGGIWTVCDGHTGRDIIITKTYTDPECDHLLLTDLLKHERDVDAVIRVQMPDKTKAAILSFTFNVGATALAKSTLARLANAGDLEGACNQLSRWVFVKNRLIRGLVNRRISEKALCLEGLNKNPWWGV